MHGRFGLFSLAAMTLGALCITSADPDPAGGDPPPPGGAPDPKGGGSGGPAGGKTFTQEEFNATLKERLDQGRTTAEKKAREALFARTKALGIETDEQLDAFVKKQDDDRKAKLSADERAAEERKALEGKVSKYEADLAERDRRIAKTEMLLEAGLPPKSAKLIGALYDTASKADGFDSKAWLEAQRVEYPELFAAPAGGQPPPPAGQRAPANTTLPKTPPAGGAPNGGKAFDATTATDDELAAYERARGIAQRP